MVAALQSITLREDLAASREEPKLDLRAEGLREVNVVVDPNDPTRGMLFTIWESVEAAQRGTEAVRAAAGDQLELSGEPQILATPRPGLRKS
jgi:heme-degrading monooxygenase HmoA